MLKTISAALLAVSVLTAPVMAAGIDKTAPAPVTKTASAPVAKTASTPVAKAAQAPVIKAVQVKQSVLNANARMGRHHYRHHRHHRFHKHFHRHSHKHLGAYKAHQLSKVRFSKVIVKHVTPAKRG
jgi:ABC-type Zn2+ transport system substrate-binding protein/surface adhesin